MNNNPFFDAMKSFFSPSINMEQMSNYMKNIPNIDLSYYNKVAKNYTEAAANTQQTISDTIQNIAKKNTDLISQNTSHTFNMIRDSLSAGDFQHAQNSQQQSLQAVLHNNINHANEVFNHIAQSANHIRENLSHTIAENINHLFKENECSAASSNNKNQKNTNGTQKA